jgi:hypothetical protein
MSDKGPFDAAITTIRWSLTHFTPEARKNSEAAIRILEAAGRVDKEKALAYLSQWKYCGYPADDYEREIRKFLEALPEKGEK